MLVLARKKGQTIYVGKDIKIYVAEVSGETVRIGIEAPLEMEIFRGEIYHQIRKENAEALTSAREALSVIRSNIAGDIKK